MMLVNKVLKLLCRLIAPDLTTLLTNGSNKYRTIIWWRLWHPMSAMLCTKMIKSYADYNTSSLNRTMWLPVNGCAHSQRPKRPFDTDIEHKLAQWRGALPVPCFPSGFRRLSRNKLPAHSRTAPAVKKRSMEQVGCTILDFSNIPTSKIMTMTWPSLVLRSSRLLTASHGGRFCTAQKGMHVSTGRDDWQNR
jgi:hypothetical protein